jgi:hypothetical protein
MGSSITGVNSFNPSALLSSLLSPTSSTASSTTTTNGVSAQQELSAMQQSGDLGGLLSDSVAVGVMQISEPSATPSSASTDVSNLVNQLIAAYAPSAGTPVSASAATPAPATGSSSAPSVTSPTTSPASGTNSSTATSAIGSRAPTTAADLSTDPALAIIQAMVETGSLGSTLADSVAASSLNQTVTASQTPLAAIA